MEIMGIVMLEFVNNYLERVEYDAHHEWLSGTSLCHRSCHFCRPISLNATKASGICWKKLVVVLSSRNDISHM
jgi:hypothetical protein